MQTRDTFYGKKSMQCDMCGLQFRLDIDMRTYERCDRDGCRYNVCRRPTCIPEFIEVEVDAV